MSTIYKYILYYTFAVQSIYIQSAVPVRMLYTSLELHLQYVGISTFSIPTFKSF